MGDTPQLVYDIFSDDVQTVCAAVSSPDFQPQYFRYTSADRCPVVHHLLEGRLDLVDPLLAAHQRYGVHRTNVPIHVLLNALFVLYPQHTLREGEDREQTLLAAVRLFVEKHGIDPTQLEGDAQPYAGLAQSHVWEVLGTQSFQWLADFIVEHCDRFRWSRAEAISFLLVETCCFKFVTKEMRIPADRVKLMAQQLERVLQKYKKHNVNVEDMHGRAAAAFAVRSMEIDLVQPLLVRGASPDVKVGDFDAVVFSVMGGADEVAEALIKAGATVRGCQPYSPLLAAALTGNVHLARLLVGAGADVNEGDVGGSAYPVLAVLESDAKELFQFLLEQGADISRTIEGRTLLHAAIDYSRNRFELLCMIVEAWLERGLPLDVHDENGFSPLGTTTVMGCYTGLVLLLEAGADPRKCVATVPEIDVVHWRRLFMQAIEIEDKEDPHTIAVSAELMESILRSGVHWVEWSVQRHHLFPRNVRRAVEAVYMLGRRSDSEFHKLHKPLLGLIASFVATPSPVAGQQEEDVEARGSRDWRGVWRGKRFGRWEDMGYSLPFLNACFEHVCKAVLKPLPEEVVERSSLAGEENEFTVCDAGEEKACTRMLFSSGLQLVYSCITCDEGGGGSSNCILCLARCHAGHSVGTAVLSGYPCECAASALRPCKSRWLQRQLREYYAQSSSDRDQFVVCTQPFSGMLEGHRISMRVGEVYRVTAQQLRDWAAANSSEPFVTKVTHTATGVEVRVALHVNFISPAGDILVAVVDSPPLESLGDLALSFKKGDIMVGMSEDLHDPDRVTIRGHLLTSEGRGAGGHIYHMCYAPLFQPALTLEQARELTKLAGRFAMLWDAIRQRNEHSAQSYAKIWAAYEPLAGKVLPMYLLIMFRQACDEFNQGWLAAASLAGHWQFGSDSSAESRFYLANSLTATCIVSPRALDWVVSHYPSIFGSVREFLKRHSSTSPEAKLAHTVAELGLQARAEEAAVMRKRVDDYLQARQRVSAEERALYDVIAVQSACRNRFVAELGDDHVRDTLNDAFARSMRKYMTPSFVWQLQWMVVLHYLENAQSEEEALPVVRQCAHQFFELFEARRAQRDCKELLGWAAVAAAAAWDKSNARAQPLLTSLLLGWAWKLALLVQKYPPDDKDDPAYRLVCIFRKCTLAVQPDKAFIVGSPATDAKLLSVALSERNLDDVRRDMLQLRGQLYTLESLEEGTATVMLSLPRDEPALLVLACTVEGKPFRIAALYLTPENAAEAQRVADKLYAEGMGCAQAGSSNTALKVALGAALVAAGAGAAWWWWGRSGGEHSK